MMDRNWRNRRHEKTAEQKWNDLSKKNQARVTQFINGESPSGGKVDTSHITGETGGPGKKRGEEGYVEMPPWIETALEGA